MSSAKLKVKQIRSAIGRDKPTRLALAALGLGRIGDARVYDGSEALNGMLKRLGHLIEVKPANN